MDAQLLERKIFEGRAQVARRIGFTCNIFRPLAGFPPLKNLTATVKVALNAADNFYKRPALFGKAVWYADFNGCVSRPGDYVVRLKDGAIWFIAAEQPLLPIVAIDCQRSVSLARQASLSGVGAVGYSGVIAPTMILGVGGLWPASILMEGGAGAGPGLPGDATEAGWKILLPVSIPLTIEASDILTDDLGRRFEVLAAELTDLGWRLSCKEVHA